MAVKGRMGMGLMLPGGRDWVRENEEEKKLCVSAENLMIEKGRPGQSSEGEGGGRKQTERQEREGSRREVMRVRRGCNWPVSRKVTESAEGGEGSEGAE